VERLTCVCGAKPPVYHTSCKECCRVLVKESKGREAQVYAHLLMFRPDWMTDEEAEALKRLMSKKNGGSSGGESGKG
jgi:hypothetical protein